MSPSKRLDAQQEGLVTKSAPKIHVRCRSLNVFLSQVVLIAFERVCLLGSCARAAEDCAMLVND